jgi:hypothetical protein
MGVAFETGLDEVVYPINDAPPSNYLSLVVYFSPESRKIYQNGFLSSEKFATSTNIQASSVIVGNYGDNYYEIQEFAILERNLIDDNVRQISIQQHFSAFQ